ncbi:hypothetical protein ABDK56_03505 [Sphingomonas sp. ASV193]|uniref:hypothetical protein n=1 Tax=Sphingomonas sp. ASV193 TaxID=3144405 RepID=UPI0032E93415
MSQPPRPRLAGGFFLIAAIIIGALWGVTTQHVLLGLEIGAAAGAMMALAVWAYDRRVG